MNIKKTTKLKLLAILIMLSQGLKVHAQDPVKKEKDFVPVNYAEQLIINTDRDIYITGEQVWCKIFETNGLTNAPSDLSRIIYIELLDSSAVPVVQVRMQAGENSGNARLRIPAALISGNYILRAYTSWMLNYPEDYYSFKTISVINPFKNIEGLIGPSAIITGNTGSTPGITMPYVYEASAAKTKRPLRIEAASDKNVYTAREKVKIAINISGDNVNPSETNLSASVVKSFLINRDQDPFISVNTRYKNLPVALSDNSHLPEPEGVLIKGVIKTTATDEPLKNKGISLSFVGKNSRCQFGTTDENGKFIFVVKDLYGFNEMVIQPVDHDGSATYVQLDQAFSTSFKLNKPGQFHPPADQIDDINRAVIAMQVTGIYEPYRPDNLVKQEQEPLDFYGKPARTVRMSDYIELTNIREVVKEILTEVVLERKNKQYILKVQSSNLYENFKEQALILVDGIPFFDIEKLLNVPARELERVDIVNTRYFYSGYIFEGIISFITKTGNLSALEFDNSVYRRVFEGCQAPSSFYSPDYSDKSLKSSHLPDFRNTLYWDPGIKVSKAGKTVLEFYTSDEPGEYTAIINGIASDGTRGSARISFLVK